MKNVDRLLEYIKEHPNCTQKQISEEVGIDKGHVSKYVKTLLTDGKVATLEGKRLVATGEVACSKVATGEVACSKVATGEVACSKVATGEGEVVTKMITEEEVMAEPRKVARRVIKETEQSKRNRLISELDEWELNYPKEVEEVEREPMDSDWIEWFHRNSWAFKDTH